ncbi:MAG: RNA-binding domain-containing protein [bacterium]
MAVPARPWPAKPRPRRVRPAESGFTLDPIDALVQVRIATTVKATEDPQKVREAILKIFPDADIRGKDAGLVATAMDLHPLRQRIFELRIIDTFRGQFLHGMDEAKRSTSFRLSKQAALAGHVSFTPRPHALGDLEVTVALEEKDRWTDVERLAFWICPETRDGEIVGAVEP